MTDFDFGELRLLQADLGEISDQVIPRVIQAVETTARHMKDDWRDLASKNAGAHARRYPGSIDYTMESGFGTSGISAEIGPDLGRSQGALGILEEADGGVRARPQRNAEKAERNNLADFERGILKATEVGDL